MNKNQCPLQPVGQMNKAVTIVCTNVYPLFNTNIQSSIGGMETRAALIGRGLLKTGGWQVRFVVNHFNQANRTEHEGILFDVYQPMHSRASENINPRFMKRKWFPSLSLDKSDLFLIWQIPIMAIFRLFPAWCFSVFWRRRASDVVCCFGNNGTSAQVIADCSRLGIRTVLCIASEDDLSNEYVPGDYSLNDYNTPKWMAHYAIENANQIFVQTENQLQRLESYFGRHGELIRNPVQIAEVDPEQWPERSKRDIILWIGRSDTFNKRPLLLLDMAKRCPDLPFLMIVNTSHVEVFETLLAECPANMTIIERVPHKEIWDYYRRARVFVNTSVYEGFPNTFLQCAVTGVPVTSLAVDPEGILSQQGCGLLAEGSSDKLERDIRSLWSDAALAQHYALTFHQYALKNHGLTGQVNRFSELLKKVVDAPLRSPPLSWWRRPFHRFVRRTEI